MHTLRVGTVNINPTVSAVFSNVKKMKEARDKLMDQHPDVDIVSFSELCICGYPPEDLIQWPDFIEAQMDALEDFLISCVDDTVYLVGAAIEHKGNIYNSVVVMSNNRLMGIVPKEKLPTYGVFYDGRTFTPGNGFYQQWEPTQDALHAPFVRFGDMTFKLGGLCDFGVEVCEDIWVPDGPMPRRSYNGAEVIFNLSASPWRPAVHETRRRMLASRSADNCVGVVYTNQVGGNDSLVFDGGSYIYEVGSEIQITSRWEEDTFHVVDLNLENIRRERNGNTTWRTSRLSHVMTDNVVYIPFDEREKMPLPKIFINPAHQTAAEMFVGDLGPDTNTTVKLAELRQAILMGMQDYFKKAAPFTGEVVSLSGGRDSCLVLLYAVQNAIRRYGPDANLAEHIFCYSMPTQFNSDKTKSIAQNICEALGVSFVEESIQEIYESEKAAIERMAGAPLSRLAKQNLQTRLRAARVRTIANTKGALLWQTGSMSEKATGYTTLGGDMEGDYSPLGNLPKTVEELLLFQELDLARKNGNFMLADVLTILLKKTIASAELEENQDDQSDLAPFPILDACFDMFFGEKLGYHDILGQIEKRLGKDNLLGIDDDYANKLEPWIKNCITRFMRSVFKWVQMCQNIHLFNVDLDRERALQIPTVQTLEWLRMDD